MLKRTLLSILLVTAAFGARRTADFDTSGNSMLNGAYHFRLLNIAVQTDGTTLSAQSAFGTITFDGNGKYSLSGQVFDSQSGQGSQLSVSDGNYGVMSNGVAFFANPLFPDDTAEAINGAVGVNNIIAGSSTETEGNFNLFIAIPAGSQAPVNSTFQGSYWIGSIDFNDGNLANVKNSLFKLSPNGQGGLGDVTVTGRAAQQQSTDLTQTSSGATYSFAEDGTGTLNIPTPTGNPDNQLFSGNITFFVSEDGNYVMGGHNNGFDIFFGFKAEGVTSDAGYTGVYFAAGFDADLFDLSQPWMESLYGSVNALGDGTSLWHAREAPIDVLSFDDTYDSSTSINSEGVSESDFYKYVFGVNGDVFMIVGKSTEYTLIPGFHAQSFTPGSGPFINPVGVFNAASFSPITNSTAPGEVLTLFGQNFTGSTETASSLPFPTTLGGVQVMIEGTPAPVYFVSPGQISAIVPYAVQDQDFIQVQVKGNGGDSNSVTLFRGDCAPGVFAQNQKGTGYGAIQHADFSLVTPDNPAKRGETILVYLTGPGTVTPAVEDGAAGPRDPLSTTEADFEVHFVGNDANGNFVDKVGNITFKGLAPDFAGLYQFNVEIPSDGPTGDVYLGISGPGCYNEQAAIPVSE